MASAKIKFDVTLPFEEVETMMSFDGVSDIACSIIAACLNNADFKFDETQSLHIIGNILVKDLSKYSKNNDIAFVPITEIPGFCKK